MKTIVFSCLVLFSEFAFSQFPSFPDMGQLPSAAFPVCGLDTFRQLIVPYGSGGFIEIPGCGNVELRNPYYYSFTCYTSGQLALKVDPIDGPQENYNWELFDITGQNPNDIYTNPALAIKGNWSGTYGSTGARNNGYPGTVCPSPNAANDSTYSDMPTLIQGHDYIIVVCCYNETQSDYFISFTGSTAVISDPLMPHMLSASVGCNKKIITMVANKHIRCLSLGSDGSNFIINPGSVPIVGVSGLNCETQFDFDTVRIFLSDTLPAGDYTLTSKAGIRDKILWDNCFNTVPIGETIPFTVFPSESVSADFNYEIGYGCKSDTIYFKSTASSTWQLSWTVDSVFAGTQNNPVVVKSQSGPMQVLHTASNGVCTDSATAIITLDNFIQAEFESPASVCPKDPAVFAEKSIGNIKSWNWNFGDGTTSFQQQPSPHQFPDDKSKINYLVTLIVGNSQGCFDTTSSKLLKLQSCSIAVPNAFTPNGDGRNDYLYPLNASSATEMEFKVFNRYGQLVFETRDWSRKWDGRINGVPQPTETYIWTLQYTEATSGKKIFLHGSSVLIRD